MNDKVIFLILIYGDCTVLSGTLVFCLLLISATFKGLATGDYIAGINSNLFNEHWIELVVFPVGLCCFIYSRFIIKNGYEKKQIDQGDSICEN